MPDPLRSIDLNLLYTYFVVVESGGVGRAATHLGRSQPAVTSRLKLLEDALGAPLLLRAGRGVQPTMLGRAVLEDLVCRWLKGALGGSNADSFCGVEDVED